MTINFKSPEIKELQPRLLVVGVGGAGGNALNEMIDNGLQGVEFIAVNTDAQDLKSSKAKARIQIGLNLTKGLGAGAKHDIGQAAADESLNEIVNTLQGANMVFITAGMGGGTGTGATPVLAQASKEAGVLTVAVVTRPFPFEGKRRQKQADEGIAQLRKCVDTLITVPNQRLIAFADESTSMKDAFASADRVLYQAVRGVSDLINSQGFINVDFADIRTIMENKGIALMGTGIGFGDRRLLEAAQQAVSSPLLDEVSISGARSVLVNITGSQDMAIKDVHEASSMIQEEAHEEANVIWGWVIDDNMEDRVEVTVIATEFDEEELLRRQSQSSGFMRQRPPTNSPLNPPRGGGRSGLNTNFGSGQRIQPPPMNSGRGTTRNQNTGRNQNTQQTRPPVQPNTQPPASDTQQSTRPSVSPTQRSASPNPEKKPTQQSTQRSQMRSLFGARPQNPKK